MSNLLDQVLDFVRQAEVRFQTDHLSRVDDLRLLIHPMRARQLIDQLNQSLAVDSQFDPNGRLSFHGVVLERNFVLFHEIWMIDTRLVELGRDEYVIKFEIQS